MLTDAELLAMIKKKVDTLMERIDPQKCEEPLGITENGRYTQRMETFLQPGWTYSFFYGMIAYMYEHFKDKRYVDYINAAKGVYKTFLYDNDNEIGHDTGFLYSLYAVAAYKITGDKEYRAFAVRAADEVAKRYRVECGHIQAFGDLRKRGTNDDISMMIADDCMNMCLLMWAYGETGHSFYREVYERHLQTAMTYLIRDDFTTRHAYIFDAKNGRPIGEENYCGYCVGSHWARGSTWIIYGLTKAMEKTNESIRYENAREGVAAKYFARCAEAMVPPWDFDLPSEAKVRYDDTSAAAIAASALFDTRRDVAEKTIEVLCEQYLAPPGEEGILLYGSQSCLWGDYFFTELVMKHAHNGKVIDFWI
ncbi:MAG: glycoside hydrolase family 88 protein [Clostridia bacterium]|nr:glycoside hydrolase family 88 protein [Clostridia bacterium]